MMQIKSIEPRLIYSESDNWYTFEGLPVREVPRANPVVIDTCPSCYKNYQTTNKKSYTCKKCKAKIDVSEKERVTTKEPGLDDVRTYGLFSSVSKISNIDFYMPHEYYVEKGVDAALALLCEDPSKPSLPGHKINKNELKKLLCKTFTLEKDEHILYGKQGHAAIEKAFIGEEYECTDAQQKAVDWILDRHAARFGKNSPACERGVCLPEEGYAGTLDYLMYYEPNLRTYVEDYKFVGHAKFLKIKAMKNPAENAMLKGHVKQVSGYYNAVKGLGEEFADNLNLIYISMKTGECYVVNIPYKRYQWGINAFIYALKFWCVDNDHYPHEMYSEQKCKTLEEINNAN